MKLRYKLVALSLLGVAIVACDPLEDIYQEIDSEGVTVVNEKEEYVLTSADYETISKAALKDAKTKADTALANKVKSELALNSFASGDKYIPAVLTSLYPSWGNGSTIGVTYQFQGDASELETKYANLDWTSLSDEDYINIWGADAPVRFLSPSHGVNEIPALLKNKFPNAVEGAYVSVDYKYASEEPSWTGSVNPVFSENFESQTKDEDINLKGWVQQCTVGKRTWQAKLNSGNLYAQFSANGYSDGEVVSWLVTPAIAVSSADLNLTFDLKYGYYNADCLDVLVSTDFDGNDVAAATWTEVTDQFADFDKIDKPSSGYGDALVNVGSMSLASYNGQSVYVAFRYTGNGPKAATTTVQIDNVTVSNLKWTNRPETEDRIALFAFNGSSWKASSDDDVVLLTNEDYDAMGAPGTNNNFSSSIDPDNYVPQFLSAYLPYAQNGDEMAVLYKFYNSSEKVTTLESRVYTFNGSWAPITNIVTKEKETYIISGGKWMFSPIINVTPTKEQLQKLVDWVAENHPGYVDAKYKDSEYWFGASANYMNFNITMYKRLSNDPDGILKAMSDDEAKAYLQEMLAEGARQFMELNYPNAETQMNGADLYYALTLTVYDDGAYYLYTYRFKSLGKGQFEQDGDPTVTNK